MHRSFMPRLMILPANRVSTILRAPIEWVCVDNSVTMLRSSTHFPCSLIMKVHCQTYVYVCLFRTVCIYKTKRAIERVIYLWSP